MIKERDIVIKQKYKVCDHCGDEITDSSYSRLSKEGCGDKHFHAMHSGGKKGVVEKTCIELFEDGVGDPGIQYDFYVTCPKCKGSKLNSEMPCKRCELIANRGKIVLDFTRSGLFKFVCPKCGAEESIIKAAVGDDYVSECRDCHIPMDKVD